MIRSNLRLLFDVIVLAEAVYAHIGRCIHPKYEIRIDRIMNTCNICISTNLYPSPVVPQRILEQWEKKDKVCVTDETVFVLRNIGQDAEVTCAMLSLKENPAPLTSVGTDISQGISVHYRAI